jgi:hypothetical protein
MNVGTHLIAATGLALMMTLLASADPALGAPQTQAQAQTEQPRQQTPTQQQTQPSTANVDRLPISLDRIREQLSHEPAFELNLLRALDVPIFRTETRSDLVFRPDPDYWKDNDVDPGARPMVNSWHYDFMKMTNPDLPQGYGPGGGVDVLPGIQSAISAIRHGSQNRQRAQVRQQIREELRQINEQRRAQGLPPLDEPSASTNDTDGNGNGGTTNTSTSNPQSKSSHPQQPSTTVVPGKPQ